MNTTTLASAAERLLDLLPQIFRIRDYEEAVRIAGLQGFAAPDPLADTAEGPLMALLAALGSQYDLLEAEVDWLYEDQFIETCADWVVPYIGALVGARVVDVGDAQSARMQVADTIRNRRSKGTARALANRARAVMALPAEAIEYAAFIARTWNPNFPGEMVDATIAINGPKSRALGLPMTIAQHTIELRDMREGGRFAPANVGARAWPMRAVRHSETIPYQLSAEQPGRYRFDPLGRDIALWAPPDDQIPDHPRLEINQIPQPIPLKAAVDDPGEYYGPGQAIQIFIAGVAQPLDQICFCDLGDGDSPDEWNKHGHAEERSRIRIDPTRGRFVLPGGGAGVVPSSIRVRYHFGTGLRAGGAERGAALALREAELRDELGERDRRPEVAIDFTAPQTLPQATAPDQAATLFEQAVDGLATNPAVLLEYGATIAMPATTTLPAGGNYEIRGGDGVWPTLQLLAPWRIAGGAGSCLILRGLRLTGHDLVIAADGLRQLTLIDCTFADAEGRLVMEEPGCKLLAVRTVLGRIRVAPSVEIDLMDCLVDSQRADTPVIAAIGGGGGGILWTERSTIIGDAILLGFDEASNSLFAVHPDRTAARPAVSAERLQSGCVRYSALPRGSVAPRRYRCFPEEGDSTSPAPVFASLDPANAAYGTLVAANAEPLFIGAENGGEMGVGNRDSYHRRKRLLDRDLVEWVPFGMVAATELMND